MNQPFFALFLALLGLELRSASFGVSLRLSYEGVSHPKPTAKDGAPGRNRTDTSVRTPDFESGASTSSTTGACVWRYKSMECRRQQHSSLTPGASRKYRRRRKLCRW